MASDAMTDIPFDIVGFDLDGTLLDTAHDLADAVNFTLEKAGRPTFTVDQVRTMVGRGAKVMLERGFEASGGCSPELMREYLPVLLDYYGRNLAHKSAPYPGLLQAMDELQARGVKLAVCTNKYERFALDLLGQLGLADRFAAIIGGDTMGPGRAKPDAAPIREMIARSRSNGARGDRTIFLGDSIFDILAAKNAGIPSISVRFGFMMQPVEELEADAILDHYDDLIPMLSAWKVTA